MATTTTVSFGTISVPITASSNYAATATLAQKISTLISSGSATAVTAGSGTPPALPAGQTGVLVDNGGTQSLVLGGNYSTAVINSNAPVAVVGTTQNNTVVSGSGGLAYVGTGSSSIAAGGGTNYVINVGVQPNGASGTSNISLGDGNDTVGTVGGLNNIVDGAGSNLTVLQGGATNVISQGSDTIFAGWGGAGGVVKIDASHNTSGSDVVYGGNATVTFMGGDTDKGSNAVFGGTAGHNSIQGSAGNSTLAAGGNADTLTGASGSDLFVFAKNFIGGGASVSGGYTETISNFDATKDTIGLIGYGSGAPAITAAGSGSIITLSDGTKIAVTNAVVSTSNLVIK